MYNDIVCFKFNKRLEIDNIRLIFLLIKYKKILICFLYLLYCILYLLIKYFVFV